MSSTTDLNKFLHREYDFDAYNCGHFVKEVWLELTGENIDELCANFMETGFIETRKQRTRIWKPLSPCLVVMHTIDLPPHVGVYVQGRVLHLSEDGARHQSLSTLPTNYKLSFFK